MNHNDTVIVIASRKKSHRLPNKAFLEVGGVKSIAHILNRIEDIGIDTILSIPKEEHNDYFYEHIKNKHQWIFTFSNFDISSLHQLYEPIKNNDYKYIVRITGDDLFQCPQNIIGLLEKVKSEKSGYGYMPSCVKGADCEVISYDNLEYAAKKYNPPFEMVSYVVKGKDCPNPKITVYEPRANISNRNYSLSLDYPEDKLLLDIVLRETGSNADINDICRFLDRKPHLWRINQKPIITFYTCVKNCRKFIEKTVKNVLIAGLYNCEYILIDDFSTDGTLLKLSNFLDYKNFKLICNDKNLGLASSSNKAINNAKGQYIMRIDADDLINSSTFFFDIQEMLRQMKNYDIMYPAYYELSECGSKIIKQSDPKEYNHIGCSLINKDFLQKLRFKDGLRHWDGYELFNRIKQVGRIGYYNKPTWFYRKVAGSMSNSNLKEREKLKQELC